MEPAREGSLALSPVGEPREEFGSSGFGGSPAIKMAVSRPVHGPVTDHYDFGRDDRAPARMGEFSFGRKFRIRRQRDFERIFARRISVADSRLVVYGCENRLPYPRLAVAVPRKIGKAVRRNRWRRLIREAFRLARKRLPRGVDLVVVARPGETPELNNIQASLVQLSWRVARKLKQCPPRESSVRSENAPNGLSEESSSAPPSS